MGQFTAWVCEVNNVGKMSNVKKGNALFWLLLEGLVPRISMSSFSSYVMLILSRALKCVGKCTSKCIWKVSDFSSDFIWKFLFSFYN